MYYLRKYGIMQKLGTKENKCSYIQFPHSHLLSLRPMLEVLGHFLLQGRADRQTTVPGCP